MNTSIYQNIATRTAGDIYIGVQRPHTIFVIMCISYNMKRGLRIWILVRLCSLTFSLLFWCYC